MELSNTLAGWLYKPYINLGVAVEGGPFHPYGVEFAYLNLTENKSLPRIQSILMSTFRGVLFKTVGLNNQYADNPLLLPQELHNNRWNNFLLYVKGYAGLSPKEKVKASWLLVKMCYYSYLLELIPESIMTKVSLSEEEAELAYFRTLARYVLNLEKKSNYDLSEFEYIARNAPSGTLVKVNAHYQMVVQNVKHKYDIKAVEYWLPPFLAEIKNTKDHIDPFVYLQLMSRYHRVAGFAPQMNNKREETIHEMDLSESIALSMPRETLEQQIAANEMLYPVLESRTKEALWLGDLDLAEERAYRLTQLCPIEPRARLHLGQIQIENGKIEEALKSYQLSVRYSPPGEEIAWFMIGQCYEAMEMPDDALNAYLKSIEIDPMAISSVKKIQAVSKSLNNVVLEQWSDKRVQDLQKIVNTEMITPTKVQPYQVQQFGEKSEVYTNAQMN